MRKILIISNSRMFFLYLLLDNSNLKDVKLSIFSRWKNNKNIVPDIEVTMSTSLIKLLINKLILNIKFYLEFNPMNDKNSYVVYGADHILGATFFLKRYKFYLIEDGTENYQLRNYKRSWKNRLFSLPKFGMHKNVVKVYLTKKENVPDCIKHKVEYINIKGLWNKKTESEKNEILNILNVDKAKIKQLNEKSIILFTQPLSEDNVLTESEKISLYKNIISKYELSKLVIKPHPREKTDYSKYFPEITVFSETYPSEVLDVLGVNFDKAVTLFSTSVFSYPKENVDFYGTKIHPKLLSRFGNIDYE